MIYETHVTIDLGDRPYPAINGTKIINLELETGAFRRQVLVGEKREFALPEDAKEWSSDLGYLLHTAGYPILRRKLEAPLSLWQGDFLYAEAHWKFYLPKAKDGIKLGKFLARRILGDFKLSWSLSDNSVVWLTMRHFDRLRSYQIMRDADDIVREEFGVVVPVHFEAVLEDTNLELDRGWE